MKTLAEILTLSSEFFKTKGIENPRRSAEELIADALRLKRLDLYLSYDRPLQTEEVDCIRNRVQRRVQGEPWQYIAGEVDFYQCRIKVNPSVLIPRQETEILVDRIAKDLADKDLHGKTLLDLCTGSGCMGIALKKRFPELSVTLADYSEDALQVAKENASSNDTVVEILQGDFLSTVEKRTFDFIVCNPPYISESAYETLHLSVKGFEPKLALVAGEEGLKFYRRFESVGRSYLNHGGKAWFEIGFDQGGALLKLFDAPHWKNVKVEKDWSGHDRFFSLEIE